MDRLWTIRGRRVQLTASVLVMNGLGHPGAAVGAGLKPAPETRPWVVASRRDLATTDEPDPTLTGSSSPLGFRFVATKKPQSIRELCLADHRTLST